MYMFIMIIILVICGLIYYKFWLPNQSNVSKYKIPILTDETVFDENYINIQSLEALVSTRDTLYIPKLGYGLTLVWDMYIPALGGNDKWKHNFNTLKPIIAIKDSPIISYHPKKNYLSITLKYRNNPFYAQFAEIKFTDMKLQRWSKYIIIIENRNVKLFIDNILVATKILPSIPVIYDIKSDIVLGELNNNFQGKIRNVALYPYPFTFDDISLA